MPMTEPRLTPEQLEEFRDRCIALDDEGRGRSGIGTYDVNRLLDEIDALRAALASAQQAHWRCFHCDETFTDVEEARAHFGANEGDTAACRIDADELARIRGIEADNAELRRENERLDNDARLWHESEADRVRRIGNCQWWQELDSREGERLVLKEQLEAAQQAQRTAEQELAEVETQLIGQQYL